MNKREILRMENIKNIYDQKGMLKSGRLTLMEQEIVGIVGLNYSGKTALIGAIAGFAPYLEGITYFCGKEVYVTSTEQAKKMGIHYIHQTSSLIDEFTVEQNIQLQPLNSSGILIKNRQNKKYIEDLFRKFDIDIEQNELTENINQSERVLIEIIKAVIAGAKIIILDSVLHIFAGAKHSCLTGLLEKLKTLGISFVLIDTNIKLLIDFCDRIYVMRKGKTVGVFDADKANEKMIIAIMLGKNPEDTFDTILVEEMSKRHEKIMEWNQVYYRGILNGISFSVYKNEVLGILNINKNSGNAVREIIAEDGVFFTGEISFNGRNIKGVPYDKLMDMGLTVLPEDDAIFPSFTVEENVELSAIKKNAGIMGHIKKNRMKFDMEKLLDTFVKRKDEIYIKEGTVPFDRLTYKRIVICRALMMQPKLMLIMHPTLNMDDLKIVEMSTTIKQICDFHCAVVVVSMDAEFLLETCSRILVFNKGVIEANLPVNEQTYKVLIDGYGRRLTNL